MAALLGLIALGGIAAICQNMDSRSVRGRVRMIGGGPIPDDVTVVLEQAEGVEVTRQLVGHSGTFEFPNLTGTVYRVIVTAKGFQTARWDVDMDYVASRYPDIYLVAQGQKKTDATLSSTASATDLAASRKAQNEYAKGHRALQDGNAKDARAHLEKAVAEAPCYARAQSALGVALAMQHEFAPAEAAFKKSIECDAGFVEAYIQSGILLNLEGKYADSKLNLQQGLGHFPSDWQLHYQLAVAYDGAKDYENAEEEYLKVQSINSTPPAEFHVKLADVYLKRKEFEKAYAEMQAYLRVAPNGEFADETKSLMRRMESAGVVRSSQAKANQPSQ
jgi:Flp pilus assembly protein TadD